MSDKIRYSSGSGLFALIGFVASQVTIPSLVGLHGIGISLLIAAGTGIGASFGAIPGAIIGGFALGIAGFFVDAGRTLLQDHAPEKEYFGHMLQTGILVGGLAGGIYGSFQGYDFAKNNVIIPPPVSATFNNAANNVRMEPEGAVYNLRHTVQHDAPRLI